MSPSPDLAYPAILDTIKSCHIPRRTESHAFLVWFLQHYYRLDETEAQDTVCDGPDDKGIDGVYVDENLETVDLFQGRLVQNPNRTLGDTQLKEFVGTLTKFSDPQRRRIAYARAPLWLSAALDAQCYAADADIGKDE
jgi:hypothetical protein